MILHPSEFRLNQFADGELSRGWRVRTAAHLERCSRCRNTIGAIRRMTREAEDMPSPRAPADLKDRILQRLANGERVILPVADPARPSLPGRRIAAAFAATVAVAVAASIFSAREAASEAGDLTYFPKRPEAGEMVDFQYRATSMFAGEDSLVLRGVLRAAADGNAQHEELPITRIATLKKGSDGLYQASFDPPDGVVYMAMAVEDGEGNRVDSRGQALWEVMVYDAGRPSYDALMQKVYDLGQREDWQSQYETAVEATRLYPDRPGGWIAVASMEQEFYGVGFDLLARPRHEQNLIRLERTLNADSALSQESIAEMYFLAYTLGNAAVAKRWRDRMLEHAASHPFALERRVQDALDAVEGETPSNALAELENLWGLPNIEQTSLALHAFRIAVTGGDSEAIEVWLDRLSASRPSEIDTWVAMAAQAPQGVEVATRRLRALYQGLAFPENVKRPLSQSVPEHRLLMEDRLHAVGGLLGRLLVERGHPSEGLAYLVPSAEYGWDVQLFSDAAEIYWGLGQKTRAFQQWAKVAVDAWTDAPVATSLTNRAVQALGVEKWEDLERDGRRHRYEYFVNRRSTGGAVDTDLLLESPDGVAHSLGDLIGGRVSVIAFWSQHDFRAVQERDSLIDLSRRLEEYDAQLITVVTQPRLEQLGLEVARPDFPFPVYRDDSGEAVRSFGASHYSYFVVDGSAHIRFAYSDVTDALNQVAALRDGRDFRAVTSLVTEEDVDRPR